MSSSWSRLPSINEMTPDQDIADANEESCDTQEILRPLDSVITLRPLSYPGPGEYSSVSQDDVGRSGLKSFDTTQSATKLKDLGVRLRRKPLVRYLRGSVKRHPAAEIEPTRVGRGLWKDQLLIDRSLRGMAALTVAFAIAMIILIATYAKYFTNRTNRNTSSVGGETESCKKVMKANTIFLLLINVCATMVLGISNTYQQLSSSLQKSDLKHMLSKFGDSRVGTNSPFNINHKSEGRKQSWAAWLLLVLTSMPVHFLANSLIGPSYTQLLPPNMDFEMVADMEVLRRLPEHILKLKLEDSASFPCWSAFRTGTPHYPRNTNMLSEYPGIFGASQHEFGWTWKTMRAYYTSNCTEYMKTASDTNLDSLENSWIIPPDRREKVYQEGTCSMGSDLHCVLEDPEPTECRLNIRMGAAFILMACLVIKATYMVIVNLLNRGKLKTQLLTFGDVIIASASDPELRVQGECMVNAGDNYRSLHSHACHKHCLNPEQSKTGDELGHCQTCKKWNSNNQFANLPQPTITTKIKKSLISNLGSTALTQMCLLMLCSLVLLGASLFLAVQFGMKYQSINQECNQARILGFTLPECEKSDLDRFATISGGFGGFNRSLPIASLPPDSLGNEFVAFAISNGAQSLYSLLYLMMIYNITLISQEYDWGKLEYARTRLRTTLVAGYSFEQNYLLQLPKKILFPIMTYSMLTHWMLGEALQAQEAIWLEKSPGRHIEHSKYIITYAAYPVWGATFLILLMTAVCWWAFTYKREGFMPQMFGSVRVLMAATTQLDDFPENGVQWGDLGQTGAYRQAGLSAEDVMKIVPNEIYAGTQETSRDQSNLEDGSENLE